MVHLSVAIGRFAEILFWAILRAAGVIGGVILLAMVALALAWGLVRRAFRHRE